jgi:hypothetical protein
MSMMRATIGGKAGKPEDKAEAHRNIYRDIN